ncbi:MAG TPA: hypothetical protein PLI09_11625 [Candidatus Hydrogenedentes bacterium]|nr:hypothetical protein [Candidatus Hydrogenedentota bacterium]
MFWKTFSNSMLTGWRTSDSGDDGGQDSGPYFGTANYMRKTWYEPGGLEAMVDVMRTYDTLRSKLACEGGNILDLRHLTEVLARNFSLYGPYGKDKARLMEPKGLNKALKTTGQYDVHLEIRRMDYGLPAYYLARTHHDCWGTYGLEVEDLYRSKDFPLEDPRFVKFMEAGRGKYSLRLSPFRNQIADVLNIKQQDDIDNLLYTLGRCVFQGAWHVDQRFSFMVAEAFDIPVLKSVIELIYMCLSIDLCALRRNLNNDLIGFFQKIYTNETFVHLLKQLPELNENQFAALTRGALEAYVTITDHFNQFLRTEVRWQALNTGHLPLWKPILANIKRLDLVAGQTMSQDELREAREHLQSGAHQCVQQLLNI